MTEGTRDAVGDRLHVLGTSKGLTLIYMFRFDAEEEMRVCNSEEEESRRRQEYLAAVATCGFQRAVWRRPRAKRVVEELSTRRGGEGGRSATRLGTKRLPGKELSFFLRRGQRSATHKVDWPSAGGGRTSLDPLGPG